MPAPNEFVWYKWFPVKAMTSVRFANLSLAEEGFYRRLYDLASIAQPSSRRGFVYEHDRAATVKEIATMLKVTTKRAESMLRKLAASGLVCQDKNGAWGFPNFSKHQRKGPLRVRADGLGSSESGAAAEQDRGAIGAIDVEADVEADVEVRQDLAASDEKRPSPPPVPPELENLELYATDEKLCLQWPAWYAAAAEAFPAVNVMAEVRKAHIWELSNPANRKKRRVAFFQRWLAKAQDKAPRPADAPHMKHNAYGSWDESKGELPPSNPETRL